jgi:hypothetical protein
MGAIKSRSADGELKPVNKAATSNSSSDKAAGFNLISDFMAIYSSELAQKKFTIRSEYYKK